MSPAIGGGGGDGDRGGVPGGVVGSSRRKGDGVRDGGGGDVRAGEGVRVVGGVFLPGVPGGVRCKRLALASHSRAIACSSFEMSPFFR